MGNGGPRRGFEFLCVDEFIGGLVESRALASAFELGLIDLLLTDGECAPGGLETKLGLDTKALRLLSDLLAANRVVVRSGDKIALSPAFRVALNYRDLLETKLDFANFVLPDFHELFTELLSRPGEFMRRSRVFDLFRYDRCLEPSAENYEMTRRWMRFTTCLTKYEAQACLAEHDFGGYRRMLDIGGNSGEFVLRICKAHPDISGTVFDLPLVCEIGREHVACEPQAARIRFVEGDARNAPLPGDHDLIVFKSFLHDWPEADAREFMVKASQALSPGGTLLIYERGPVEIGDTTPPYSSIPTLLFFQFYRSAEFYTDQLAALGFRSIEARRVELEVPFHLIVAQKAS